METYVKKFIDGAEMRKYLETNAMAGEYVVYCNRLHRVIDCDLQGLKIAVCKKARGEGE